MASHPKFLAAGGKSPAADPTQTGTIMTIGNSLGDVALHKMVNSLGFSVENYTGTVELCEHLAKKPQESIVIIVVEEKTGEKSHIIEMVGKTNPSARIIMIVDKKPASVENDANDEHDKALSSSNVQAIEYVEKPVSIISFHDALVHLINGESDDSLREELLKELRDAGFVAEEFKDCTILQMRHLLQGAKWLQRAYQDLLGSASSPSGYNLSKGLGTVRNNHLTDVDKKMLRFLLESDGKVSSLSLSKKLDIPLTTVQRRRKKLESEFLEMGYTLKLEKLGWRRAELLISTYKGKTSQVGKELLSNNAITRVCRSIGEHTIDLHADIVIRNNGELVNAIEWVKSLEGVKDVIWTEPVEVIGENDFVQFEIVDKYGKISNA